MKKLQFSKLILGAAVIIWVISVGLGWYYVFSRNTGLIELLTFIGSPVSVAWCFYSWKAKAENIVKIANHIEEEAEKSKQRGKKRTPEDKAKLLKMVSGLFGEVLNDMDKEGYFGGDT